MPGTTDALAGHEAFGERPVIMAAMRADREDLRARTHQHHFIVADMATALQTSRILLWRAATALDDGHPDKVELCAMAKQYGLKVHVDGARFANAVAAVLATMPFIPSPASVSPRWRG